MDRQELREQVAKGCSDFDTSGLIHEHLAVPSILVLDDDPARHRWFRREFSNVTSVTNVGGAIKLMIAKDFDVVFLDHDLGGPFISGPDGDGIDVAKAMAEQKLAVNATVIIHSANPDGAKNIRNALEKTHETVIICPFWSLKNRISDQPA